MTLTPHRETTGDASRTATALRGLGLDADDSSRRRTEYSYDASNYRLSPLCVVFPRTDIDVATAARWCHEHGVPIIARGGGTGMGGNAIGEGVVIDFSRHMDVVTSVDVEGRTAVAQSGVVLTALQKRVREISGGALTFAPDPSSQSRATVGGAIGNDACGNHSVRYGRTTDHVVAISLVTADGVRLTATRTGLTATDPADSAAVRRAEDLTDALRDLVGDNLAPLRTELERIPRQVSGYHLAHLLPERGFDVARALVGSEGTCAIVVSATVSLVPVAAHPQLLCLGYRDVVDAARDVPTMLSFSPSAIEGIDERIVATMRARRGRSSVEGLPDGKAWIYVELDEFSAGDVPAAISDLLEKLRAEGRLVDARTVSDPTARSMLWRVREDGAGLSSRLVDLDDPDAGSGYESWPGWEDSAVAPENLPEYLEGFQDLLAHHGLTGVMYGHFGAGCMHVRITFDQRTASGRETMLAFCRDAAHLVVAHGGSLSGEHGDGRARSELLPIMYSPTMMSMFAAFKDIWDPARVLNPGSIVDPDAIGDHLALDGIPARNWTTAFDLGIPGPGDNGRADHPLEAPGLDPFVHATQACIGVGRCRSHSGGVMCPSYRATRDEKDSTRARARVLQEMTRTAPDIKSGWRSKDVRESLDLCLSCKACSTDCPTGVDMATYRSEFFSHHYRHRLRPMSHYALGWMPAWLRPATAMAPMINAVLGSRLSVPAARVAGLDARRSMPRFARRKSVRAALAPLVRRTDAPVVLFLDSFTKAFRPDVATAAARVLGGGDTEQVSCEKDNCCALTWISTGQLDHAKKVLNRTATALDDGTDRPIVVPEPSCAAALRKDLPELVHTDAAKRVAARVRSFAAHVGEMLDDGYTPPPMPESVTVQTHCHEYAVFGPATQVSVLRRLGVSEVTSADGCCGVAGNFGFERGHYEVSMAVGEQALAPALRARSDGAPVLTDGFSCAMAVDHLSGVDSAITSVTGTHLAQLLDPRTDTLRPDPLRTAPSRKDPT
ncbi:FAD-linked oxidase [Williamsia sp. Leaf354]|uniref:FAD-binding and (Fe-S)-binding domain-containing protein n=1 Tax=Williamsia sp. Leaf354 TaxID=1736349 RepID=UPI0006FB2699|nr:FAD-binding and (Fe-S)-binding domain-containing protein [Williamsia sp. Leaf354]KQR96466.1 FAD-linked oxidase [Williamsia sp. Leaf354]